MYVKGNTTAYIIPYNSFPPLLQHKTLMLSVIIETGKYICIFLKSENQGQLRPNIESNK